MELKFKSRWPPRGGKLKVGLEKEQWIFLYEWAERGGLGFVLAQVGRNIYLFEGRHAEELYHGVTEGRALEIGWCREMHGGVWEELAHTLSTYTIGK